ncbi:uncharacterized protein BDR25DRAFT_330304 [Lindgomyces ingoldianus]|uniref:Uncharacterized protein n=1 Tax=Lindgomyces ingoldianus TaxID=673940 RepID=A0ACB6RGD8_9PLEO|nr:uncharacterized protein BDR25DRAFT_330304 [Lindgomyces ingoldianus]KAF2477567.1 hypothetical protein BDR25DRAFT_330304 [Lindgomyces ingoldianus]
MPPLLKKPSKPVFKTDIPFTETTWPLISPEDQEVILDLLCTLLAPIGIYRKTHTQPPKRKSKKRKRATTTTNDAPPPPPLGAHILIGLNSVTRHLSTLATKPSLPATLMSQNNGSSASQNEPPSFTTPAPLTLLILPHPSPSSSLPHAHLPTLVHLASLAHPDLPPTRLIPLSSASEARLASTLQIPRVGAIGIQEGAPGASALVEMVRGKVGTVKCQWIDQALAAEWRGVKIATQKV